MKTAIDIWNEHLMMNAVDPRPINTGDGAAKFIQYLIQSGYLPNDISAEHAAHLRHKIDGYIYDAVLNDRKDRISLTNTDNNTKRMNTKPSTRLSEMAAATGGDRRRLLRALASEAETLEADRDNLRAFIENIIRNECWDQQDYLDGGSVQDEAERMGILRQVPHAELCEIEGCPCHEYGPMDYLYQFAWKP